MFSFVILFACFLSNAQSLEQYCAALGGEECDYEFFCLWDGASLCDVDYNAEVSFDPIDAASKTDAVATSTPYNDGTGTVTVYYSYSEVKDIAGVVIDQCSLDYAISLDLYSAPYCDPQNCGLINYGTDGAGNSIDACFDFCYAHPTDATCTGPCPHDTGKECCAIISTGFCTNYCTVNGTMENCCGGPPSYDTVLTGACQNYVARYSSDAVLRTVCLNTPANLTACALCDSYYECCSKFKTVPGVAAICNQFCTLDKPADKDCEKRKNCLESLGHEPSDAELAKCGTSVVRLSSFTVAVLLGIIAFFFLN